MTASDNWFVFNVDNGYCTVFLCVSDRICSLLHTCSVHFVIMKNCFVVTASCPFFVGIMGSFSHFFRAWGNTTYFQNELKETLTIKCNKRNKCLPALCHIVSQFYTVTSMVNIFFFIKVNYVLSISFRSGTSVSLRDSTFSSSNCDHRDNYGLLSKYCPRFTFIQWC